MSPQDNIIYEDSDVRVVLAYDPISKGHVVIIPTKKFRDIDELPKAILNKIMKLAQCYVQLLKHKYSPKGYSIMQNGGDFNDTGQFHLHIFPRNSKEEFSWTYCDSVEKGALEYKELKNDLKSDFYNMLEI